MLLQISFGLVLVLAQQFCHCSVHIHGTQNAGLKVLYDKEIFATYVPQPKNYTIIFKYIGSESSPNISYAIFEVYDTVSDGAIEVSTEVGKEKTLQAMLNIVNGTNIRVNCRIMGPIVTLLNGVPQVFNPFGDKPKTMTVVYGQNSTQTQNRIMALGQRQQGDEIIDFQHANVTAKFHFAEHEFEYHNKYVHITAAKFSFDYPTATAFINSSFVGENKLNAIVYDLNTPWFIANMTIFGYRGYKPAAYSPIVQKRRI